MRKFTLGSTVIRFTLLLLSFTFLGLLKGNAQTYYDMSTGDYSQPFTGITTLPTNWSLVGVLGTGTIPVATKTTVTSSSSLAVVGSSTAIGIDATTSAKMVFLVSGATDNNAAIAVDLNLNFTGRTAGNLSCDFATVFNSTGNRLESLHVYYTINGTSWTEITGTNYPYVATNNVAGSASAASIALPSAMNNQSQVTLRFYCNNGTGGSSGSRPKISLDNVSVTSTAAAVSHTVTFNNNGGSGTMTAQVASASTALSTNTFTRTGYTFSGWNTAANASGTGYANSASYSFSVDATMYAQWSANSNTITFDANGGSGSMSNQNINTAASANLSTNTFTKAGYSFAGWATTALGSVAYADAASYTMGTGNVTLYAKWTANNNTITFNANGGTGSMSNQTIATAASANLSTNTYTYSGSVFSGWNTAADGSGTSYADGASYTMGTSSVTLYAQWSTLSPQTITFGALTAVTYGDASFSLSASASSGLTVSFASSDPTIASISGSTVTILKAGTVTITASQSGNGSYSAATSVNQSLTINAKVLTVTGLSVVPKSYNSTNAATLTGTPSLSGIVGSDDVSISGTATATFVSVNYSASPITVNVTGYTLSGTNATNYSITQPSLSGTINKAAAYSITSSNDSKNYGTTKSLTSFTTSGLFGSDAVTSVTLTSAGTASTATVSGSPYTITITPGSESGTGLSNYNTPTYNSTGTLTVNVASLTVTATSFTRALNPYLDYSFAGTEFTTSGLITANGDAVSSVSLASPGTVKTSTVGTYTITPSAAVGTGLANYTINYSTGTMTVSNIIADWTFEGLLSSYSTTGTSPTLSLSDYTANTGLNTTGSVISALHASSSTWTSPSGNGSARAISSANWAQGDYYQIKFSTSGYENVNVSMDQTGSNTGPRDFKVQYSTTGNDADFHDFGSPYSIANNSWSAGTNNPASVHTYDLSSITALNDAPFVYLRVVVNSNSSINGSTIASGGTGRLDNLLVTGNAIKVATQYYSNATGNLDDYTTWNTNTSGTGGSTLSSAADFTAGNAVFNISNANPGTISGSSWTVSGIGSKVVVNGTDLTIGSKPINAVIDVNTGRTLTISNTTFPTFGTITAGTIKFKDISGFTVPTSATYGNVIFDNATISSTLPASSTPLTFAGNFTLQNGATFVNSNINLTTSGTSNQTIAGNSGSISIRNLESNNTTAKTGTLTLASNTAIAVGGSVIMNNTGSANVFNDGGNTITIGGNLTLAGNAAGYNLSGTIKLTAAGGSTAIISSNGAAACVAALNNLTVDLTGTAINCSVYPTGGGSILNINGNLTFGNSNAGTGNLLGNNNTINLFGNYSNTRSTQVFSNTSQNIVFGSSSANQTISSAVTTGEIFSNITISNLFSGGKVTANNDITISGTLTQSAGNLEIVSGKTITFNSATTQTSNGIIGAGKVTRTLAGIYTMAGTNTFTGSTSFSAGTINVTGTTASDVTVASAAILTGTGNVNGNIALTGALSPNTVGTVGTLNASNTGKTLTLNSNSTIKLDFTGSVTGTAGTNWDKIALNGDLNIAATNISTLNLTLTASSITGFSSTGTYSWPIITGASSVTGFDANAFNISSTGFTTDPAYGFSITKSGNDIILNYGLLPVITVSTTSLTNFGKVVTGSTSVSPQTYTVSGTNLTTDITITAPTGFLIKTPSTSYASVITLSPTTGTVASTVISVEYAPQTASGPSGSLTITNTSDGAPQKNVTVSGTAIDTKPTAPAAVGVNVVNNTIDITVTPASSGAGAKRLVVVYPAAVTFTPSNGTVYTAQTTSTIAYASGQTQTGGTIVYNGTGTNVTVTGLNSKTLYAVAVYDYNDNNTTGAEDYSSATTNTATTLNLSYTYIGTGTSSWTTTTNWSPNGTPANGDDVTFNSGTVVVTGVPASTSVSSLTVTNNANVTLQSTATSNTVTIGVATGTNLLTVNSGSTLSIGSNLSLTMFTNSTANIAGTLVNANTLTTTASGVVMNINAGGTLKNAGTVTSSATTLLFKPNSTYNHNLNAGSIPTANWDVASTITVTGCTTSAPSNLTQQLGNFDWNSTSQSQNVSVSSGTLATINGNLTLTSTGTSSRELRLVASNGGTPANITIGGNVTVSTGTLVILGSSTAGTNTSTVTVTGKVTVNTGGTINMNGGANAGNSTLNISGDLELNGGSITRTFGATGSNGTINLSGNLLLTSGTFSGTVTAPATSFGNLTLNFNKVGTQNATFNSAVLSSTANVPVSIAATSTVKLLSDYTTSSTSTAPFTITNGGYLELNGHTLNVSGTVSGTGKFNGSASGSNLNMNSSVSNNTVYFGTGATDSLLNTLTLSGTGKVTLGSGVGITSLLSLNNASAVLDLNNHYLTLKSTSLDNTAELDSVKHGATIINGNVTVERFISKELRNYRDLGASVANAGSVFANWQENGNAGNTVNNGFFITGTAAKGSPYLAGHIFETNSGLDYTTSGAPSMYTYNGTTWPAVTSTKALSLNPFQGYRAIVRGARNFNMGTNPNVMPTATTVRTTGKLVTGNITITTAGTTVADNSAYNSSFGLTTGPSAYSLIANPYACPVQWSKILGHSSIYNTYWYIDPTYQDPSTGLQRYITVQYSGGSIIVTPNPKYASGHNADPSFDYIQSGQGFMVNNYGNATPSITFREGDKTTGAANNDVFGQTATSLISIELYKNNGLADAAVANFNNNFTKAIGNEDASKMINSAENISITESNSDLSIDGLPTPYVNDVIPVRMGQLKANTTYQLKADISNFNTAGLQAYVRDNMLNTEVAAGSLISFTPTSVDIQSYKDRFSIVFKQSKVVVPVVTVKGSISVFPNPVTAKSFKVQTSNIASGKYNVVMVNTFGQEVMSTPITHVEGSNSETITMSKALTSGVYTLVLKSAEGKTVYQTELLAK